MPIYEYRCDACGFQKDHLQKISDAHLVTCPECGTDAYKRQLSAAGFQLKGTGWYATDFKGGKSADAKSGSSESKPAESKPAATPCGGNCACH
ncbi:MAG: zinc ribbon domain-containing protein [Zoogloeaceae bacterium]|nr:zinc ribbon domain-containing protein [Rhodocyclaceae bacterium]MCP5234620.1 zinc ribbon domain-containing protein [Zoogloeaceae bacterium]